MINNKSRQPNTLPKISEKTLSALFDYQLFENDPSLRKLIDEVENEYGTEIPDETVAAEKHKDKRDGTI